MQYIPVKTFDTYITAHIWLNKFLDENIDCYLKDEYTATISPIFSNAIGGIKLCVNDSQIQLAQKLILQYEQENKQLQKCPKCGSLNVQYITQPKPSNWLVAILSWVFTNYALGGKQVYHCFNCGYEFDEIPPADYDNI